VSNIDHEIATRNILVVDDNKSAADVLGMLIMTLGHEVETVYDGQTAIDVASKSQPDVIFMDIGMPIMDGNETAAHIRQQQWSKNLTLVALTGWGGEEDKRRSKEAGFDHHVVKPVDVEILKDILANCGKSSEDAQ
jgi:CheY-like chemotaxis protein